MQRKIRPDQVRLGMYVRAFGGSWFAHPFWRAKFVLKTQDDVDCVRQSGVPYVVIDEALGIRLEEEDTRKPALGRSHRDKPPRRRERRIGRGWRTEKALDYREAKEKAERKEAVALVTRSKKVMRRIFDGARLGLALRVDDVLPVVDEIAQSVERGPRTLLDVIRLKNRDEYTYLHSIAVCTLMVNLARYMGKGDAETRDFGLAGLLHDIGKMGIPEPVLHKPGRLTDAEFEVVRAHPQHGHRLLSDMPEVTEAALDVCLHHHEKVDGTGYPFGLQGEAISQLARIGAICDVYDALTSDRAYKEAWSPTEALDAMWNWEGHFDRELLFTFMRSVGIFPPGLLVRMRSSRLGVVLEGKRHTTNPSVLCFYDLRERAFLPPEQVEVTDSLASDGILASADPGECGIDDWEGFAACLIEKGEIPRAMLPA